MLGFNWAFDWIERDTQRREEMPCTNWQLDALPLALFPSQFSVRPRTTSMRLAVYSHERTN